MASYIDNVFENARIQDIQAFTPDWSFLTQAQQQLSATQRKNFSDFAQKYNSIIDSDLTREDNVQLRDDYKKKADDFVKQVSGMDLTDPRNLKAAEAVFTPLVDNKLYIRDIINTRTVKDTFAKAQRYASSANPVERDLYNENSLKQLNYFLQDFKKASADEASVMQAPNYLDGVNLEKMALNFFNSKNYDVEVDSDTGQWIVKTKNGRLIEDNLFNGLLSQFYGDPLVRQNISLENEMSKRDYVENNITRFNGNTLAAENAFYQEKYSGLLKQFEKQSKNVEENIDSELDAINYTLKELDKGENTDNPAVNDEPSLYSNDLTQTAQELARLKSGITEEKQTVLQSSTIKSKATAPYSITVDGKTYSPEQLDSILFQNRVAGIAKNLAYSRFSQTLSENKYTLEKYKSDLDIRKMNIQADLDWRNKERELKLESILTNSGMGIGAPDNSTDIALNPESLLEDETDKKKLVDYTETQLDAKSLDVKNSEDKVIKTLLQLFPKVTSKALNELNDKERKMILKRAQNLIRTNALSKSKHSALAPFVDEYNVESQNFTALTDLASENLRTAINASEIPAEDRRILSNILKETSVFSEIKEKFSEIKGAQIDAERKFNSKYSPAGLSGMLKNKMLDAFGNPKAKAAEIFDDYFSDEEGSIADQYFRQAKEAEGKSRGYNVGVGGYIPMAKDLGQATNTDRTEADVITEYAYKAALQNNIRTAQFGDFNVARKSQVNAENTLYNAQPVLQLLLDQVKQQQKETTSTLKTLNVKTYVDPFTQEQYIYFRPNEALNEILYNTEKKAGLVPSSIATKIIQEGVTFKLPKGALPANILGLEKVSPYAQLFALKGSIKVGGNTAADGGYINVVKNKDGTLDVVAARYEGSKTIPLPALENELNKSYSILKSNPNVDADLELYKIVNGYMTAFKQAN
jgi:hypothetical protein